MKRWILLMLLFMVGCSNSTEITEYDPDGERYTTPSRHLSIAIIGNGTLEPITNVAYTKVDLDHLSVQDCKAFDGIIVTADYLAEAAKKNHRDFFMHTKTPVFFFGAERLTVPLFTDDNFELNDVVGEHGAHVAGYVNKGQDYVTWELHLPENATEKDKTTNMMLRICAIIEQRSSQLANDHSIGNDRQASN